MLTLLVLRVGGALIWVERPVDRVLDKAVPEDGAGMIEHDGVRLTFVRSQHPANHLPI